MTPEAATAALDRALAITGEDAILQRPVGNNQAWITVKVRAQINGFQPSDLIAGSGIQVGDSMAVMSLTQIVDAQWPGAYIAGQPGTPPGDVRIPAKGDRLIVGGRTRSVQATAVRDIGGEPVRLEVQIR